MIMELDIPHLNVAHMLKIIHHAGFVLPESKTQIRVMSSFAITLSYPENQRNLLAANWRSSTLTFHVTLNRKYV